MSISREDFLKAKLANFAVFIKETFAENKSIQTALSQLVQLSPEQIIAWAKVELVKYRSSMDEYIKLMLAEHDIDVKKIEAARVDKLRRYMQMIIDVST